MSFNAIYSYYTKMAQYHTNIAEIPIILVGTQDAISESNPRLIDDTRARKLASDLKRCAYYETCATYGLNVERVFQDGKTFEYCTVFKPVYLFCSTCNYKSLSFTSLGIVTDHVFHAVYSLILHLSIDSSV